MAGRTDPQTGAIVALQSLIDISINSSTVETNRNIDHHDIYSFFDYVAHLSLLGSAAIFQYHRSRFLGARGLSHRSVRLYRSLQLEAESTNWWTTTCGTIGMLR